MIASIVRSLEREKGITVQVDTDVVAAIAAKGYSPEFGAREMRRVISDTIETHIANIMLNKDISRGDRIRITKDDISI